MPKAILEYNLPEETEEYTTAMNGASYASALSDIYGYARTLSKYDQRELVPKEEIIDKLFEILGQVDL